MAKQSTTPITPAEEQPAPLAPVAPAAGLALAEQLGDLTWDDAGDTAGKAAPFGVFGWLHGVKAAKTPGVFYAKDTEFGDAPRAPWVQDDRFNEGERPEMGYSASALKLAIIGARSQWYLEEKNDKGYSRRRWLAPGAYQDGARKQVEWLCFVEGVDAPMILSASKLSKSRPIIEALAAYRKGVLRQASLKLRRTLPLWSFWLPLAGEIAPDGRPVYTEVKGADGSASYVTYPKLSMPGDAIDSLFVGRELFAYGAELHRQYADWLREVRLPDGVVDGEVVEGEVLPALPAPGGRNVPQPVGDDSSLPF